MISENREYRAFELNAPDDSEEMIVEGQAVAFESPTVMYEMDGIKYYEIIDRNAFANCDMRDVVFVENHGGTPGARTKNNTLELPINDQGMFPKARLFKSSKGPAMYSDIKNGIYDKMSFSFTVRKDSYDKQTRTRKILEIERLYDVSVVTFAAYNQTSIMARSYFNTEVEKERMEMREREHKLKKLALLLNLTKGD